MLRTLSVVSLLVLLWLASPLGCGDDSPPPAGEGSGADLGEDPLDDADAGDADDDAGDALFDVLFDLGRDLDARGDAGDTVEDGAGDALSDADLDLGADADADTSCGETLANPLSDTPLAASTTGARDNQSNSCGGAGAADLAFTMRASADGTYRFGTTGAAFDPVVAVYQGVCGATELGCDAPDAGDPEVELTLRAGQIVTIVVDGQVEDVSGDFTLTIEADLRTSEAGLCLDGRDNDGDGDSDCSDDDCASEPACSAFELDCGNESDDDGDGAVDCADTDCCTARACADAPLCLVEPPDPADIAPPLPERELTSFGEAIEFLYASDTPVQRGVLPGTIDPMRAAVIRGAVYDADAPLRGVRVAVVGRPELGITITREDGSYDLVVNGGGQVVLSYSLAGYVESQRTIRARWRSFVAAEDVVLVPYDSEVTTITLGSDTPQVARGTAVSDEDGARQATLYFPAGVTATLRDADGDTTSVASIDVRATEFTVGPDGPARMPATLPPTSAYTYAVELSADEAIEADDADVVFATPVYLYVENFLDFPVGGAVPVGFYDRRRGMWEASDNGRIIEILSETSELADLDIDGDRVADTGEELTALGIDDAERAQLATLYEPGATLWRTPIPHFTPWDCNWPYGPPDDARPPEGEPEGGEPDPDDENQCVDGSIVEVESRILRERVAIAGTPFSLVYSSDRVPGRRTGLAIRIPVTTASVPPSVTGVQASVEVAGQIIERDFDSTPNQTWDFLWDGRDGFGREVFGAHEATVRVRYLYQPVYLGVGEAFQRAFARIYAAGTVGGASTSIGRARDFRGIAVERQWSVWLRRTINPAFAMGGWSLDVQHVYDPDEELLYEGSGTRRSARNVADVMRTFVGGDATGFDGDGGPASAALVDSPRGMDIGPDGAFYFADASNRRIRRVDQDGIITTVAGTGEDPVFDSSLLRDGGPALAAALATPIHIAFGPDDALYIACLDGRIRRVDSEGIITTAAGGGSLSGAEAEGALATEIGMAGPWDIAFAPDGSYYVGEGSGRVVRHIGTDGRVYTVTGRGTQLPTASGVPASDLRYGAISGIAVMPNGDLLVADATQLVVVRIGSDGIARRFAGNGFSGNSGDGGPASAAAAGSAGLAVGPDGSVYLTNGVWLRRVDPNGTIRTIAGSGRFGQSGEGLPALESDLASPAKIFVDDDGVVYFDDGVNGPRERIRAVRSVFPGVSDGEYLLPSRSGQEIYVFNRSGRHLRTLHGLTGETLYELGYDSAGRLVSITDISDNVTTIERDGSGAPTAIVAPFGQRTTLRLDGNGYIDRITDPAGGEHALAYTSDGLLSGMTDPRGGSHSFTHDAQGMLESDSGPAGRSLSLAFERLTRLSTRTTTTTAEGLATVREVSVDALGTRIHESANPDGSSRERRQLRSGALQTTHLDGSTSTLTQAPDPRLGLASPHEASSSRVTPGGVRTDITRVQRVEPEAVEDVLTYDRLVDEITIDGNTLSSVYERATRTRTTTSAEGRVLTLAEDGAGRPLRMQFGDELPVTFEYDESGRQTARVQGDRRFELSYDDDGYVVGLRDSLERDTTIVNDELGRPTSITYPGSRTLSLAYDEHGNITRFTPPGAEDYDITYDGQDELSRLDPPDAVPGVDEHTSELRDDDGRFTSVTRATVGTATATYDGNGRLATLGDATFSRSYGYDSAGFLSSVTASPGDQRVSITRDGMLTTGETWSGPVSGSVTVSWTTGFLPLTEQVNGGNAVTYEFDGDGLLVRAGALALTLDEDTGRVAGTTLSGIETSYVRNGYGEVTSYTATYLGSTIYSASYEYDDLARLTRVAETVEGVARVRTYTYDAADRLDTASEGGTLVYDVDWDANSNRVTVSGPAGELYDADFDARDRMTRQGTATYSYDSAGTLTTRFDDPDTTSYAYDSMGNLRQVTVPDGRVVSYVIDGSGRRVARAVDGTRTHAWLYGGATRVLAELDASGVLVSRFVYAGRHVPAYMIRDGVTYAIISDHLGSPRLIVDVATGTVAQRMDYDVFGVLVSDSNPGFQPFGFAGGLWDADTGLLRFTYRDYDPETGRWTTPDPLGLRPGATNLYTYVGGDPQGFVDPLGLQSLPSEVTDGDWARAGEIIDNTRARMQRAYPNASPEEINSLVHADLYQQREDLTKRILDQQTSGGESCSDDWNEYMPLVIAEHRAWGRDSCSAGLFSCAGVAIGNTVYDAVKFVAQNTVGDSILRSNPDIPTSPATVDSFVAGWAGIWDGIWD